MRGPYDDIMHLPHPVSTKHPPMPVSVRAAQYSPFAALTGHDAAIRETARLTERKLELDEDTINILDMKLHVLSERINEQPEVSITYFKADKAKEGGSYETIMGFIRKIDMNRHTVVMENGNVILIDDIFEIESDCLDTL